MTFSLIIGTLNRLDAIKSCLKSILEQTNNDYEVIIVDQSDNTDTEQYIAGLNNKNIIYRHVDFKGLSRARNEALKLATGNYFCLMDDDAYYQKDYLEVARRYIAPDVILTGYIFDTIKENEFVKYRANFDNKIVTLRMIMRLCPSAALVIPMELVHKVGMFDENFGVGSRFGSGEETDLLLRGIQAGFYVKYVQDLKLKHPVPVKYSESTDEEKAEKRSTYFKGLGALYKKHMVKGKMNGLKLMYGEVIIKFIVKKFAYKDDKKKYVCNQFDAFRKGYKEFH